MEPTNEDASRILKGMLKIGQPQTSNTDNGQESGSPSLSPKQENPGDNGRPSSDNENTPENGPNVESIDSFDEQISPRISLDPVYQLVPFSADEQKGSVVIYGNEVHIITNEIEEIESMSTGSNRVRINPVVNFDWEHKFYNGNLLSVSSQYISYALRGKSGFVVRILNRKTVQKTLIKDFTGNIEDLSFAHYNSDLLACIDSAGDVFVWTIHEEDDKILYNLKLHLKINPDKTPLEGARITWCPYIEDNEPEEDGNESEQILAVTVGNVARVVHISMVTEAYGETVDIEDVKEGIVRVENGHTKPIGDIALAPDGSVLATASDDGDVKFWQLDFDSVDPPRCLHEWQPHEGKPVSRLIFCDNLLVQDDKSPFWRFLITGANHNSELKIWCTVTWTCLQTIRFQLPASNLCFVSPPALKFKASLDLSAKYLVLSDVNRKVLYVFLLHEDLEQGKAHVTSVTHFILTQPLLSFVITEAKMFKASVRDSMDQNVEADERDKPEEEQEIGETAEASEDDVKLLPTVKIKLHCINPKAMQELTVQYHPYASVRPVTPSTIADVSMTSTETGVQDGLSDFSGLDTSGTDVDDVETKSDASPSTTPKLIAPNAFTSSAHPTVNTSPEPASMISSITSVTSMNNSFGSISVEDFLGKSQSTQVSESALTFNTCQDETLQGQPSRGPENILSWTGHGSPLGLPLPESPDPAKVPFPAFKSGGQGGNREIKPEVFSGMCHSTPIRPRNHDQQPEEDTEKTPTGENGAAPSERDTTSDVYFESEAFTPRETAKDQEPERREPSPESDSRAGTVPRTTAADSRTQGVEGSKSEDVEHSFPALQHSPPEPARHSDASQRNQARSNLTVTPRKQINIPPEPDIQQKGSESNGSSSLSEILSLLRAQQTMIQQLTGEVQNQQRQHDQQVSDVLREEIAMIEGAISSKIETALAEHAREQDNRFDRLAREKQSNEKQKNEKFVNSVSSVLSSKVEKAVKNEIKNSVNSGFQKVTASLQEQLNSVLTQKLTATDAVLKESIQKMVRDKSVVEAIGNAVSSAVQKRLLVTMSEFTSNTLLPGFEKACQAMYNQLNSSFKKGLQEYLHSLENFAENQKELQKEQRDPIVHQLQTLVQEFQTASEKLSTSMSGSLLEMMQTQLTSSMKRLQSALMAQLQDDLSKSLHQTIQTEVRNAVAENSMNESMSHQSPQVQFKRTQLRIQQLITDEDFSEAFQEALTAADLGLVVMVCQACDPVNLFSHDPCPLSQPILLSLIQQLSVDLSTDTELKHRYLKEAVVSLDTDDPITREHVAIILNGLCQQIKLTIQKLSKTDSSQKNLQRPLKALLMAAQSLL